MTSPASIPPTDSNFFVKLAETKEEALWLAQQIDEATLLFYLLPPLPYLSL
jgi:hypothetical protein